MMKRTRVFAVALTLAVACGLREDAERVTVVTTPDVAGIGVVEMLARRFSTESKVTTTVLVTEERFVPELVTTGVADVVVTASPALQRELQRAGAVRLAQTIAYNDYMLVGPKRDPARVKNAKTEAEALRRIARRDRAFCSPVDVPELREREAALWGASPAAPGDDRRYRLCPGSALEVLQEASRRSAYTLTDRSTFENAGRKVDLVPLLRGTALLHNHLSVLLMRPQRRHPNAEWFVQWVMSHRGRDAIERYRFEGDRRLFLAEGS